MGSTQSKSATSITRRKFIATGVGATVGYSLLGLIPRSVQANIGGFSAHSSQSRLTSQGAQLKDCYDVLIVGSGYGGSILSARLMTQEGLSLCLLERGREWHPGEFPTGVTDLTKALRTPVNPLGLIDITAQLGSDIDVISGSGLGGTSLINGAVAVRPEKLVFEQNEWPDEIRYLAQQGTDDEGPLWEYYDRVERVLKPMVDPRADDIVKIKTFKTALKGIGYSHENLPLNINHSEERHSINEFGVAQGACVQCGDCCSGCNAGAKNTLAMNYLPMAKKAGAEIFTGIEVTKIEKNLNGYKVCYVYHGREEIKKHGTIQTKVLILSAGSMGTTEILLRSQHENNLSLSSQLGTRLSANGDVLSCSYNGNFATNVVDYGNTPHPRREQSFRAGQALMSASKFRGSANDLSDHFLLLDGPVPTVFAELLARTLATVVAPSRILNVKKSLRSGLDLASIHPPDSGALNHTLLMLACGHDSAGGKYVYNGDGRPKAVWPHVTKEASFKKMRAEMKKVNDALGGTFIKNPRSELFGGNKVQVTHPLGGCPMGNTPGEGVVDHLGQVFDADGGIHRGLFVADASIIPRSLGATPLMTVSALSERIADSVLAQLPELLSTT